MPEVVGQSVDRDRLDGGGDSEGRLEAEGKDPHLVGAGLVELVVLRRRLGSGLEQRQGFCDRWGGHLGLHGGGGAERTCRPARVEAAANAVRVAQLLPQATRQPGPEHASQQGRLDDRRKVARIETVDPDAPDPQLALHRAGPVDDHDSPSARRARRDRPMSGPAPVPGAELPLGRAKDELRVKGARHDQVGQARSVVRGMVSLHVCDRERLHRLRQAGRRPVIGRIGVVQVSDEALVGQPPGLGSRLQDVRQALGPQAFELARIEARLTEHLGQEGQPRFELIGKRLERRARAVPARLAAHLDPEPLGRLGEGRGIQALRARDQQLGGECRHAALPLVLGCRARIGQQVDAGQGCALDRHQPDGQPVCQAVPAERWEVVRTRRAGRRAQRVGGDCHAAPSACSAGR